MARRRTWWWDPDATVDLDPTLLADAKYKGRDEAETSVSSTDLYESVVFLQSAGMNRLMLVYPRPGDDEPWEVGQGQRFSKLHS